MYNFKFDWDYRLELGISKLDNQHKELFKIGRQIEQLLLKQCISTTSEQILKVVYELRDYITYHFYEEEKFLRSIKFPDINLHCQRHDELKEYINRIDYVLLCQNPQQEFPKIKDYLVSWVFKHMVQEDQKITSFLQNSSQQ